MGIHLHSAALAYGRRDNEVISAYTITSPHLNSRSTSRDQIQTKSKGEQSAASSLARAAQHRSWERWVLLDTYASC